MAKYVACARCGDPVSVSRYSKSQPEHRACQKMSTRESHAKTCVWCGTRFTGIRQRKYCSLSCAAKHREASGRGRGRGRPRTRPAEHPGITRHHRERAAPGLTAPQRTALLHEWQRVGRTCAYCDGPCETVDHIIALVRGGTNYEGNLTPACRRCNGSKRDRTIVEWRNGRPAAQFNDTRTWMVDLPPVVMRVAKLKVEKQPHACPACGKNTLRKVYCSEACMWEWNARSARERQRAVVGLAPTWDRPVRRRAV